MLYFAYGSNMIWKQMKERCPSARFLCRARLPDYKLAFTWFSSTRKCGVADVTPLEGSCVWGVVYQIGARDVGRLDWKEGYRPGRASNSYEPIERHVEEEGKGDRPLRVTFYVVRERTSSPLKPSQKYKRLMVDGARNWRLPEEYVRELERIEVQA